MDFTAKNVIYVGGLGGIGYESCKQLIKKPIAMLFVLSSTEKPKLFQDLQSLNTKVKIRFIKFNLADKLSIQNGIKTIVNECKYIDILINGAGVVLEKNYERQIQVNLIGLITTTFEALPYMDKQRHGRGGLVVNMSSMYGLHPAAAHVIYSATKFGIVGFTRSMADPYNYNLTGVAFVTFCPGFVRTPFITVTEEFYTFDYSKPLTDLLEKVICQTPQKCAEHLIRVIETNKNNSIWLSDEDLNEIEPEVYWAPKFEK